MKTLYTLLPIMLVALLLGCQKQPDPVVNPTPQPDIIQIDPIVVKPNEETAPKEETPEREVVPPPKKEKAPIRYDKSVELPGGYFDYCEKYPTRPECGAR